MQKKLWIIILFLPLAFLFNSCQSQLPLSITSAVPLTTIVLPTSSPALAPTSTLSAEASPNPTDIPQPPATPAPACFVTKGIPFAFMPDSKHIFYKGDAGIQIVDLQDKQSEDFLTIPSTSGGLATVTALSTKGDLLAIALTDNSIQVYQTTDKKLLHTLMGHTDIISELEFSTDGEKLYSASHDTWVRVWDRNGKQTGAFQPAGADDFPSEVLGMALSADGQHLANRWDSSLGAHLFT